MILCVVFNGNAAIANFYFLFFTLAKILTILSTFVMELMTLKKSMLETLSDQKRNRTSVEFM